MFRPGRRLDLAKIPAAVERGAARRAAQRPAHTGCAVKGAGRASDDGALHRAVAPGAGSPLCASESSAAVAAAYAAASRRGGRQWPGLP